MLNHFVVVLVFAICAFNANGEDMFLNKPQTSPASSRYHVKWLTDYIKFPLSFEKQCPAGEESEYLWKRRSDDLLITSDRKFENYEVINGDQKTKLAITQVHLDHPEELAIYQPVMKTVPSVDSPVDYHIDLYALAYLKSHSILVNKTQDMINITCVADFLVPNGFDEDINDGILAKMERNAIFKMSMNSLNAVKKEKNEQVPSIPAVTMPTDTTTIGTPMRVPFVQADQDLEKERAEKDEMVKAQLKLLLQDLHKNHHPEKLSRDPSFSQTWSHIQRSRPISQQQNGRPRMQSPPIDNPIFSNQIFQAQQKVQDKLMMLQSGVPVVPVQSGKPIVPEIMINPMQRIPNIFPIRHQVPAMPFAVPFGMQMPMFAFMNKRKRFARQADSPNPTEEKIEVPEVTSQIISNGDENSMKPEPIQQIRLKYGPITLYRPLRQAEIITCNLKLLNHDDMKIDHQSTVFATIRRDTADRKAKPESIKTNPQYDADDEAKWATELNDITNTLKKKIQLGVSGEQELPAPKADASSTTPATPSESETKLDQYEAELQKPESQANKMRTQASALKKAQPAVPSSSARSCSIDIALFLFPLLVYYFTSF